MKKIEIYTKDYCPYCYRAKKLLQAKGAAFIEYDVTDDPIKELEMRTSSGRSTVPEIFVDDLHVGGCDELYALEAAEKLEDVLGL